MTKRAELHLIRLLIKENNRLRARLKIIEERIADYVKRHGGEG